MRVNNRSERMRGKKREFWVVMKREWRFMTHVLREHKPLGTKDGTTVVAFPYRMNAQKNALLLNYKNKLDENFFLLILVSFPQCYNFLQCQCDIICVLSACEHSRNSKQEHLIQWLFLSVILYSQSLTPIVHEKYF